MSKNIGSIRISYDCTCPNCDHTMYSDINDDWWEENFGVGWGSDDWDFKTETEVTCEECKTIFEVDHFEV